MPRFNAARLACAPATSARALARTLIVRDDDVRRGGRGVARLVGDGCDDTIEAAVAVLAFAARFEGERLLPFARSSGEAARGDTERRAVFVRDGVADACKTRNGIRRAARDTHVDRPVVGRPDDRRRRAERDERRSLVNVQEQFPDGFGVARAVFGTVEDGVRAFVADGESGDVGLPRLAAVGGVFRRGDARAVVRRVEGDGDIGRVPAVLPVGSRGRDGGVCAGGERVGFRIGHESGRDVEAEVRRAGVGAVCAGR